MPTNRQANRDKIMQETQIKVTALRVHWLQQLLDWPLEDGSVGSRLTKAEVAVLRRAAEQGKLFHGTADQS